MQFEEFNAPIGQDKVTSLRNSSPSDEADKRIPSARKSSQTRRGQTVHAYLLYAEIEEVDRIRKHTKNRTRLAEITDLVRIGLSVKLGKKHADVILPPILDAVRQEHKTFLNRFLFLIGIIAYKIHRILYMQERMLWLQLKHQKELDQIIDDSQTSARVNSTRRTPQINEVIEKLKVQMESK